MSGPEGIRVDARAGRIDWDEDGAARQADVEGAVDARRDREKDRLVVLVRAQDREGVAILSLDGETIAFVRPPEGYAITHFAHADGPILVGQGEASSDGWQDWHFAVDDECRALRRLGPAY
ncbi:MAG TPA: hypothetical protein VIT45_10640 [Allosphingosinicella sp.]